MASRLWHMNADFEAELASLSSRGGAYRRLPFYDALNDRLAPHLLRLARPGDALLLRGPWGGRLRDEARRRGVELCAPSAAGDQGGRVFTPWGWTPSAAAAGERTGAEVRPVPFDAVARVNSKLWSHALEVELGVALPGAAVAPTFAELSAAVARACPRPGDKWVVKSPHGFAARDRVLGRGPALEGPPATWSLRRLGRGETLVFQPWLEVVREYGVVMEISPTGSLAIHGVSDLQTNGAGTATGYLLGRPPTPERAAELERIARAVGGRLFAAGYHGPAGIDALEHAGGLHPLLEVNARYTMGFVAVAGQHFGYGRGARRFHRARAARGAGGFRPERAFYLKLLRASLSRARGAAALAPPALLLWAQLANAAGFFYQRFQPDDSAAARRRDPRLASGRTTNRRTTPRVD
ncbi:MAG: hypothetical protein LC800_06975 [Acidobacteria bacterium]|nr:hypothetical protein [Acidobacteriota bacterium]